MLTARWSSLQAWPAAAVKEPRVANTDRVLVVGAGMAGLAAARALHDVGCAVVVLEARDRVGGRVDSRHAPDSPVAAELGAEFVQGLPPRLHEIARRAGLLVCELGGGRWRWEGNSFEPGFRRRASLDDEILNRLAAYSGPDKPLQKFLDDCARDGRLAASAEQAARWVEGYDAAHVDRIGTRALARQARAEAAIHGDRAFRVPTGYDGVARWLLAGLPNSAVRLGAAVSEVAWEPGQVSLATSAGAFSGRAAVITVPLPVLGGPALHTRASRLRFMPELPETQAALRGLHMGSVIKIVLRFREPFWWQRPQLDGQLGFLQTPGEAFPTWWTTYPVLAPQLVGWAGGPAADALAGEPNERILERALDILARVFHVRAGRLLASWYLHNWQTDPFAGGAYSYVGVHGLRRQRALAQPVSNTLFFAGEATELAGHHATVHGAIATGERAAREVLSPVVGMS
jgi:monoamine oxidase